MFDGSFSYLEAGMRKNPTLLTLRTSLARAEREERRKPSLPSAVASKPVKKRCLHSER